ncbi:hypothetical protein WAF17_11245 [Bernardetia sp. ABR2-2B]|uniref:hypothetical protein n=1 Tax=Bernardetia sp. ABR2-2B TaxID=3127472 RepID=UPI0030D5B5D4
MIDKILKAKHWQLFILMGTCVIFQFVSCQSSVEKTTKGINKDGYTISYPSHLKLDESGQMGTKFLLFTEKTGLDDDFVENINLVIQDLEADFGLDEFVKLSESQIKDNGKLISSEGIKDKNSEFHKMILSANVNNSDLKFIQYCFVKDNKAYVLTFTAKEDEFEKYAVEMEEIMQTFELK